MDLKCSKICLDITASISYEVVDPVVAGRDDYKVPPYSFRGTSKLITGNILDKLGLVGPNLIFQR